MLQIRGLRSEKGDERIDYDEIESLPRAQTQDDRSGRKRYSRSSIRAHCQSRKVGRRALFCGHGAHRRISIGRRHTSSPVPQRISSRRRRTKRCADREAVVPVQSSICKELDKLTFPGTQGGRWCTPSPQRRVLKERWAVFQGIPEAGGGQHQAWPRPSPSTDLHRHAAARTTICSWIEVHCAHHGNGRRKSPRPRRHHRQQEFNPVRSPAPDEGGGTAWAALPSPRAACTIGDGADRRLDRGNPLELRHARSSSACANKSRNLPRNSRFYRRVSEAVSSNRTRTHIVDRESISPA